MNLFFLSYCDYSVVLVVVGTLGGRSRQFPLCMSVDCYVLHDSVCPFMMLSSHDGLAEDDVYYLMNTSSLKHESDA